MSEPRCFEKRLGRRKIYGIEQEDGTCQILSDCPLCPDACVKFNVPLEAAITYFEGTTRPPIQDLFRHTLPEHREILVTGTSPAEFDQITGKPLPENHAEFKARYAPLGYHFAEDEE